MEKIGLDRLCARIIVYIATLTVATLIAAPLSANSKEIKVMVIDTGIGMHTKLKPYVQYQNSDDYLDQNGHGTHVTGILLYGRALNDPVCSRVKVYACKSYDSNKGKSLLAKSNMCLKRTISEGMSIIQYSNGGSNFDLNEYLMIKTFTDKGGVISAAAGNQNRDLTKNAFFPASYYKKYKQYDALRGVYAVMSVNELGQKSSFSNFGPSLIKENGESVLSTLPNNQYGRRSGTSQAAPIFTHKLLKELCKQKGD